MGGIPIFRPTQMKESWTHRNSSLKGGRHACPKRLIWALVFDGANKAQLIMICTVGRPTTIPYKRFYWPRHVTIMITFSSQWNGHLLTFFLTQNSFSELFPFASSFGRSKKLAIQTTKKETFLSTFPREADPWRPQRIRSLYPPVPKLTVTWTAIPLQRSCRPLTFCW